LGKKGQRLKGSWGSGGEEIDYKRKAKNNGFKKGEIKKAIE